jgi:DNA polymerase III subunit beta
MKEFPEQPLTFDINTSTLAVVINSENGRFNVVGHQGVDFPVLPVIKADKKVVFTVGASVLLSGINRTLLQLPMMNSVRSWVGSL